MLRFNPPNMGNADQCQFTDPEKRKADCVLHIQQELSDKQIELLESGAKLIEGIHSFKVNRQKRHLALLEYDANITSAKKVQTALIEIPIGDDIDSTPAPLKTELVGL
ncbi:hypothetical protein [Magnetococcus sp. PR-3]|uniref:hypothetical protein n=1 Tax=Magnetococcus sp. PR-3 TaxID=3120355 RepID=UPI002FCE4C3D